MLLQKIKACHGAFCRPEAFTFIIRGKKHFPFFFPNIILHRNLSGEFLFSRKNPSFSDFFSFTNKRWLVTQDTCFVPMCLVQCSSVLGSVSFCISRTRKIFPRGNCVPGKDVSVVQMGCKIPSILCEYSYQDMHCSAFSPCFLLNMLAGIYMGDVEIHF